MRHADNTGHSVVYGIIERFAWSCLQGADLLIYEDESMPHRAATRSGRESLFRSTI